MSANENHSSPPPKPLRSSFNTKLNAQKLNEGSAHRRRSPRLEAPTLDKRQHPPRRLNPRRHRGPNPHLEAHQQTRRSHQCIDRQLLGGWHTQTGADILNLASVKAVQGDLNAAEHLYREGRAIMLAWDGPDHPDVATASSFLAKILTLEGKEKEAEPLLQGALRIQETAYGPVHDRVAFTLETLGGIAVHQRDFATAETDLQRALAINTSLFGDTNFRTAVTRGNLAMVYLKESKNVRAEAMLHQAVDVLALLPPGNNLIATARERWGRSLLALKRYSEAQTQLSLAEQLLKSQPNSTTGELVNVQRGLAALADATQSDKAVTRHSQDTNAQVNPTAK